VNPDLLEGGDEFTQTTKMITFAMAWEYVVDIVGLEALKVRAVGLLGRVLPKIGLFSSLFPFMPNFFVAISPTLYVIKKIIIISGIIFPKE